MPAIQLQQDLTTLEQYEALPEDQRVEVFDGVVYDMVSPSAVHQRILTELLTIINIYIKKNNGNCNVFPAPFDVKLSDEPLTIVQPDILIVCDKNKLDDKRCNGAPDFIIEIMSPNNAAHDYIKKSYYYENHGVREYWIVDPRKKTVTVNYFEGNVFNTQYSFDSVIKVNIYDDLYIDFTELSKALDI